MFRTLLDIISGLLRIGAIYLVVVLMASCAHGEKHEEQEKEAKQPISQKASPDAGASMETKQVAAESNAPFVTEVSFAKGKAALSKEMQARLTKLYAQATQIGQISEIRSFAWSDDEYPAENAPALPASAHALAESRNKAINDYFSKQGTKVKLNSVTMTERPSGLKEKFNLGDTKQKAMFEDAGVQDSGGGNKAASAKKSKAVVMLTLKKS